MELLDTLNGLCERIRSEGLGSPSQHQERMLWLAGQGITDVSIVSLVEEQLRATGIRLKCRITLQANIGGLCTKHGSTAMVHILPTDPVCVLATNNRVAAIHCPSDAMMASDAKPVSFYGTDAKCSKTASTRIELDTATGRWLKNQGAFVHGDTDSALKQNLCRVFPDNVSSSSHLLVTLNAKELLALAHAVNNYSRHGALPDTVTLFVPKDPDDTRPIPVAGDVGCGVIARSAEPSHYSPEVNYSQCLEPASRYYAEHSVS